MQYPSLEHDSDCKTRAGIVRVVHVISAVCVVDVDVVGVVPAHWPRVDKPKPIAAILEAGISVDENWLADMESVLTPKMRAESIVWNSAATPRTQAKFRLRALSIRVPAGCAGDAEKMLACCSLMLLLPGPCACCCFFGPGSLVVPASKP